MARQLTLSEDPESDLNVRRMTPKEFREAGYLQEVNRQYLHILGLALDVVVDEETGEEKFTSVFDFRDNPLGMIYSQSVIDEDAAERIDMEFKKKHFERVKRYGWLIQPPDEENWQDE